MPTDLLEHQAKAFLREAGVAVPEGRLVRAAAAAREAAAALDGEVMVKAQVARSDRASQGGVKAAADPEQAESAARAMLAATIGGARVEELLVEQRLSGERELYLGATYDLRLRAPVLIGSAAGGTGVEAAEDGARRAFSATEGCPAHVACGLGRDLGLEGRTLLAYAELARRLARLFLDSDATLLEINPVLVTGDGVVALDAHCSLDEDASTEGGRFAELRGGGALATGTAAERAAAAIDAGDHRGVAGRLVEFGGSLGMLIGGGGASLTVFDAVLDRGLEPFNYCEIGGNPTAEKIARLTKLLLEQQAVERLAVIMNVVNNTRADLIAEGVLAGVRESGRDPAQTIAVFRVPGHDARRCRELLAEAGVTYLDEGTSLEAAVDALASVAAEAGDR